MTLNETLKSDMRFHTVDGLFLQDNDVEHEDFIPVDDFDEWMDENPRDLTVADVTELAISGGRARRHYSIYDKFIYVSALIDKLHELMPPPIEETTTPRTWTDLKALIVRFDNACWHLIGNGDSRYSPTFKISCMFDSVNVQDFSESWHATFQDEFFPFTTEADTREELIDHAYAILAAYTEQIEANHVTAHYLTGSKHRGNRTLEPFSVEQCRNWTRWEVDFQAFPDKASALAQQQAEQTTKRS